MLGARCLVLNFYLIDISPYISRPIYYIRHVKLSTNVVYGRNGLREFTVDRKENPDIKVVSIKCKYVYCLFVAFLRNKSYFFVKIHVHFLKTFF